MPCTQAFSDAHRVQYVEYLARFLLHALVADRRSIGEAVPEHFEPDYVNLVGRAA